MSLNSQKEPLQQESGQKSTRVAGFGVAASPFNRVKMEMGIGLLLGIVLWLAADSITASFGAQLLLLAGYGVVSAAWLVIRTRQVLRQCENQRHELGPD